MIQTQFTAGGFPVYKAEDGDYSAVSAFLNTCRNKLDRIEFFYPYTPEELKSVISGGGFLCAVDGGKIIGAFALDTDKSYGKMLADNVKECTRGTLAPKYAFETSGLMVDENYRRRGMAGDLADAVIALGARLVRACPPSFQKASCSRACIPWAESTTSAISSAPRALLSPRAEQRKGKCLSAPCPNIKTRLQAAL